jgi:hypothetical protein
MTEPSIPDRLVVGLIAGIFCMSVLQKFPNMIGFAFYSDLVSWYYSPVVVSMNAVMARFVTYPGFLLAGGNVGGYVLVTGTILFFALMLSVVLLLKLLRLFGLQSWRALLLAMSPSFFFFAYCNIDMVGILFILGALYFTLKQRWTLSAASLGLAVATKVFPILYVPFVWLEQESWKQRVKYAAVVLLAWSAVDLPFMFANFQDWFLFVTVQGQWGIENSWMIFVIPQLSPASHYLSYLLISLGVIHILTRKMPLERAWFAATLVFVLASFKFPPTYFLYLLPYIVILGCNSLGFLVADVLNALIIATWFTPWISGGNPLASSSPTQWISLMRQAILLGILMRILRYDPRAILREMLKPLPSFHASDTLGSNRGR